jgi:hypothetical protein
MFISQIIIKKVKTLIFLFPLLSHAFPHFKRLTSIPSDWPIKSVVQHPKNDNTFTPSSDVICRSFDLFDGGSPLAHNSQLMALPFTFPFKVWGHISSRHSSYLYCLTDRCGENCVNE